MSRLGDMEDTSSYVSFIGIVDFSEDARWVFASESCTDLLGFEPYELVGKPALDLVHPDEFPEVKKMHYDTISGDKAATLAYLRMRHKDPYRGYVLCAISRTVVYDVLVGSVSFATPGAKAMHNASTANEVTVITPFAVPDFEFRRWSDPSPMPPSPLPPMRKVPESPTTSEPDTSSEEKEKKKPGSPTYKKTADGRLDAITFDRLPNQSIRVALILDRFSIQCPVIYVSNDLLIPTTVAMGRSFYDFVTPQDEKKVRSWIDAVKSWGVNERGSPSDGGFGHGRFNACVSGRDSNKDRLPDPTPSRHHRDRDRAPHSNHRDRDRERSSHPSRKDGRSRAHSLSSDDVAPCSVEAIFSAHSDGILVILRTFNESRPWGRTANLA
ncbi:hypothetical protein JAAARDRAFT_190017 [Jaapia argillacea MUCL 33604]|uniref:PAS domain-containing protein n=1 Tax=Jaapia argillacea MUCL 33604 TaxID=933084 RepID=A0A067Q982_9AGAM|nr:hypothetical protein JAAARDRAFT_190017 [Jaapia argillacea MUCL 33604]